MSNIGAYLYLVFIVALALVVFGGAVWSLVAPCSQMGWMPVKDIPARCVPGVMEHVR